MSQEPSKRVVVSVEVAPEARAAIDQIVARSKMIQKQALGTIFEWFVGLDERLQDAVLKLSGDERKTAMLEYFRSTLANDVADMDYERMLAMARKLLDEMASRHRTAVRVAKSMNETAEKKKK